MTAYVSVEASLLDAAARDSYMRPILKQFGGETKAWTAVFASSARETGDGAASRLFVGGRACEQVLSSSCKPATIAGRQDRADSQ